MTGDIVFQQLGANKDYAVLTVKVATNNNFT